jgi:hypothetical protein
MRIGCGSKRTKRWSEVVAEALVDFEVLGTIYGWRHTHKLWRARQLLLWYQLWSRRAPDSIKMVARGKAEILRL